MNGLDFLKQPIVSADKVIQKSIKLPNSTFKGEESLTGTITKKVSHGNQKRVRNPGVRKTKTVKASTKSKILPAKDFSEVLPITQQHTCEICRASFNSQLSFFEHLKTHYENVPAISSVENVKKGKRTKKEKKGKDATRLLVPEATAVVLNEETSENSTNCLSNVSKANTVVESKRERSSMRCRKCKKFFRKETNFKQHIECCENLLNSEESVIQGVDENNVCALLNKGCDDDSYISKGSHSHANILHSNKYSENEWTKSDNTLDEQDEDFNNSPVQSNGDSMEDDEEEIELMYLQINICPSCDEHCGTKENLDKHIQEKHAEIFQVEPLGDSCHNSKNKNATASSVLIKKPDSLKCKQCHREFNHRNSLVYHMRSHTGERPFKCESCGKRFFSTSALKVHVRLHSGVRPYPCDECERSFRQWGDLKYHKISIHSGERTYQCEFCGKDFARKYSLVVHRRIHTGERNYKCEDCSKCFRAASYLQNHRRIHTGEKPHKCPTCGKPFRVRSDMRRHMASHSRDAKNPALSVESTITVATVPLDFDSGVDGTIFPVITSSSTVKNLQVNTNMLINHQEDLSDSKILSKLPLLVDHNTLPNKIDSSEQLCVPAPIMSHRSTQSHIMPSDSDGIGLSTTTYHNVTLADHQSVYSTPGVVTATMVTEGMTVYQDTGQNLEVLTEQGSRTSGMVLVPLTHTFIQN